jgi:hypothetical protein
LKELKYILFNIRPTIKKPTHEIEKACNRLYNEAQKIEVLKQQNVEKAYSEYTFSPRINRHPDEKPSIENFYQRLQSWKDKMNENYAKSLQKSLQTETGAPLFTPQILNYEITPNNVDISNKLYHQVKDKDIRSKKNNNKCLEDIKQLRETKLTSGKTDELNQKMKKEGYRKIFEKLDYNNTSLLCYEENIEHIIKASFNESLCRYLLPIVEGMKSQNETLSFEEFSATLDHLCSNLSVDERRSFINELRERKKQVEAPIFTFSPEINDKTKKVFSHSKRYSQDLLERNDEFVKNKHQFLSSKKEEQMKEELNSI